MGYPMNYSSAKEIFEEIAKVTPSYGGISYERIEKKASNGHVPRQNTREQNFYIKIDFREAWAFFMPLNTYRRRNFPMKNTPSFFPQAVYFIITTRAR
jgi:predicted molibdopterin-dependent oxidoreductase YjgC